MSGEEMPAPTTPPRLDEPEKSYAEVAVNPPPVQQQQESNGSRKRGGKSEEKTNGHVNGDSEGSSSSTPPQLVDPLKSYAEAAVEPPPPTNGIKHNGIAVKSPGEYEGSGILDAPPTSPTRSAFRKPRTRNSKSELRNKSASTTSLNSEDTLYESYHHNGQLTSIKPPEDYEENLALDERERRPRNSASTKGEQELQIASGRIAAEGWDRSGYVDGTSA